MGLWSIDFAGRLHDSGSNPVNRSRASDMPLVGTAGNTVLATDPPGAATGTFLGSTPLEDMWGLFMLDEMDNLAEYLVATLNTSDGSTLTGSRRRLAATQYDYTSPLRWFPAATAVTDSINAGGPVRRRRGRPTAGAPTRYSRARRSPTRRAARSISPALLLGNALLFGETDARNVGVGQRIGLLLTFDGDPFPADDGSPTARHDARSHRRHHARRVHRSRSHAHRPAQRGGRDHGRYGDGLRRRGHAGTTVTMTNLAHVLIGLRQTILSLNGVISQYGAADPDPSTTSSGS